MTPYSTFLAIAAVSALLPAAAAAIPNPEPASPPFALSLGVTFSGEAMLSLETLSASVATGGGTALSNATAARIDGAGASSSNGGASMGSGLNFHSTGLRSTVAIDGDGFRSSVGPGGYIHPAP
ncbi:hypothetical protein [Histidinibacterium lentulum]|uniref:Uncharacterized protein n=1 Tax=Histidinibacterium lentulum TaxID=2480588 RepID=A0A3N2R8U9_9RHOB|nr:hypothetical protein [Histidinibacterium lentulum]ROU03902.1 hypothetical protein EAT49_00375 [Histidinibacterium lentulum]